MITRQKKRTNRGRLIAPLVAMLVFGYFGTQAYKGDYGIRANIRMQKQAAKLTVQLEQITKKRQKLEKRVVLLSNGTIEKDMLDEQARRNLGWVNEDDVVILR